MNTWLTELNIHVTAALTILLVSTAVLIAGLIAQQVVRRSPAVRHAVLLWTLLAVGLCPMMFSAMRLAPVPASFKNQSAVRQVNILLDRLAGASWVPNSSQITATRHFPFAAFLLTVWAAGALLSLSGLVRGLLTTRRIRQGAQPLSSDRIESIRSELLNIFGQNLPPICISDQAAIPMAVGYLRPVIMLSPSLMAQLNDQQLFQVLVHECAHALRQDALVAPCSSAFGCRCFGSIRLFMSSVGCLMVCAKKSAITTCCKLRLPKITRKHFSLLPSRFHNPTGGLRRP